MLKYEQFVCMCTYETLINCLRELSTLQYTGRGSDGQGMDSACVYDVTHGVNVRHILPSSPHQGDCVWGPQTL